uniref:Treble clef zinc finger domain-containing protein n=1 Tax=uncultured marine thaumarchaeote KM3_72_A09 TaxID=1456261 RepID=A0A075HNJ9_9ARCH|nr:hypothetical protein [uncultured marine thaumarchaeote KM3_72_A09]
MPHATREYNLAVTHPAIADQWHPTKNGTLTASDVTPASGKKAWWVCDKGHEYESVISSRTKRGSACPECFNQNRGEIRRRAARRKRERSATKDAGVTKLESFGSQSGGN